MITLLEKLMTRREMVGINDSITKVVTGILIFNPDTKMIEVWDKELNIKVGEISLTIAQIETWKTLSNENREAILKHLKGQ